MILQHDYAPSVIRDTIKILKWNLLPHPRYSPDLASSDFDLLRSMAKRLAGVHLSHFEEMQKWVDVWIYQKILYC